MHRRRWKGLLRYVCEDELDVTAVEWLSALRSRDTGTR